MDISMNGGRPTPPASPSPASVRARKKGLKSLSIMSIALLFSIAVLVVALTALLAFGKDGRENRFVNKERLQAVFLNGGQVYFGNITTLNDDYIRMNNIYYLRVNQQVQPEGNNRQSEQDISLVKLGCELHGPEDQMVLNREQVIFWENLKADGQVAKAVQQYVEQNPNGQKCETSATTPSTNNNTQGSSNQNDDN